MAANSLPLPPDMLQLSSYDVNRPGWEAVRQSLYDSAQYVAAGQTQLSFFSTPVGQGTTWAGGAAKNNSDTNMTLAGQLPQNQEFLVQAIEIGFYPTTPTVAAQMPAAFGAQVAAQIVNDAYIFRRAGNLTFVVGSKAYLQEGPLMKFPTGSNFEAEAALADVTTAGANLQSRIAFGKADGRVYSLTPTWVKLVSNQNFSVTLNWPEGVQAITNPARVVVSLQGILYRRSQ